MALIICREYFGKLLFRYRSDLLGGREFDLSYCGENGRDSSSDGYFGPVITSLAAAMNQNLENSESSAIPIILLYFESKQTA